MREGMKKPNERVRQVAVINDESATDDSFGNDTDINRLVERFTRTGIMPTADRPAQYADVSGLQNKGLDELIQEANKTLAELQEAQAEADRQETEKMEQAKQELENKIKELEARQQEPPAEEA